MYVKVTLDGKAMDMELDTGAVVSVMSEEQQKAFLPEATLCPTNKVLHTYTECQCWVKSQFASLNL